LRKKLNQIDRQTKEASIRRENDGKAFDRFHLFVLATFNPPSTPFSPTYNLAHLEILTLFIAINPLKDTLSST
jgi:hypothetical protein